MKKIFVSGFVLLLLQSGTYYADTTRIDLLQAVLQPNSEVVNSILSSEEGKGFSKALLIRARLEAQDGLDKAQAEKSSIVRTYKGLELNDKRGAVQDTIQQYQNILETLNQELKNREI